MVCLLSFISFTKAVTIWTKPYIVKDCMVKMLISLNINNSFSRAGKANKGSFLISDSLG